MNVILQGPAYNIISKPFPIYEFEIMSKKVLNIWALKTQAQEIPAL